VICFRNSIHRKKHRRSHKRETPFKETVEICAGEQPVRKASKYGEPTKMENNRRRGVRL